MLLSKSMLYQQKVLVFQVSAVPLQQRVVPDVTAQLLVTVLEQLVALRVCGPEKNVQSPEVFGLAAAQLPARADTVLH